MQRPSENDVAVISDEKKPTAMVTTASTDGAPQAQESPIAPVAAVAKSPTSKSKARPIPDAIKDVLNVSFPRCAVCGKGWYDAVDGDDNPDSTKPAAGDRKRKRHRTRPSHFNLLPLPPCKCTTRLALPDLPSAISHEEECKDPMQILSQIQSHPFLNLATCRPCLEGRIAASKEVTKHDYRQDHVENGQRSVNFTVGLDCTLCHRKFMSRVLERLLESDGGSKTNASGGGGKKKKGKSEANWWEAVDATIRLVGFAKREKRRERKKLRRKRKAEKEKNQGTGAASECPKEGWWERLDGFTGGDDSDDCYSFSSDSDDEWDADDDLMAMKGPPRQELKSGELAQELMQKDPLFRQEKEDEEYVKQLLEKEGLTGRVAEAGLLDSDQELAEKMLEDEKRAAEERARADEEMAKKLQEEFNKQSGSFEPVKTRSRKPRPSILDALNKAARKSDEAKSPVVDLVDEAPQQKRSTQLKRPPEGDPAIDLGDGAPRKKRPRKLKGSPVVASIASSKKSPVGRTGGKPKHRKRPSPKSAAALAESDDEDDDVSVRRVMEMGFTRASARRSLDDAEGDVDLAISMLLSEIADRDSR